MQVETLVIGGGIAGISAAAELAAHGSVLILEAEEHLGHHATGRSAAMFLPSYGNAAIRALTEASAAAHAEADSLSPRDFLCIAPAGREGALAAEARAQGLKPIGTGEAQEMWPILRPGWVAAAARAEGWDLDADRLLQTMRRRTTDQGARIVTRAPLTAIHRDGAGWHVEWPGGSADAGAVVNAAGAWADRIAQMAGVAPLGLVPHRRSMAQLAAPGGHDVSGWPFVEEVGERWYAKPDAGSWLVSPADADPVEPFDAWADDMVLAEGLARYEEAVIHEVTRPLTTWAGLRTFAPDKSLVIGPDPTVRGFWWCAGQGGYGLQTAPAAARLLADLMAGRAPLLDAAPYAPARLVA
ncbi:Glycine/D-amino acid oxidase [Palleronia marisminoris]|uniref:N-methyltryptophan oxidase n=1 Tax=Palleronia marisminoris TaxID=315423 RepID=A0A1Y5RLP8_9RHOB|nr:FAD-binding oxidoreductase [Palleronia marisminoris]SFG22275.1 Glycine/D-amino acid oxidase [Palleronia marisminoris]SLN17694.1 N-methyltryptophan oxidase [Palleronia marisminoris]